MVRGERRLARTARTPDGHSVPRNTTGSRGTLMGAGSVMNACKAALADGCKVGIDYEGEWRVDWTNALYEDVPNPLIHAAFGYAAQLAAAEVDTGLGTVRLLRIVAAHDRYPLFFEHGDAEAYRQGLERLRRQQEREILR